MKFLIDQIPLSLALQRMVSVIDRKGVNPSLSCILFELSKENLRLSATDLETSLRFELKSQREEETQERFCLNARNLYDIVRELPSGPVQFTRKETELILKSSSITYYLVSLNSEDFPTLSFGPQSSNTFWAPSSLIGQLIEKTFHATSMDETRAHLGGLCLHASQGQLRAVGLDGSRLAYLDSPIDIPNVEHLHEGLILPRKGVLELKRLAETWPEGTLAFSFDETYLYCQCENNDLSIRLVAKNYPKYQDIIPENCPISITLDRTKTLDSVKRVKVMASEKIHAIIFNFTQGGGLTIKAGHSVYGRACEEIPCHFEGDSFQMAFNGRFLSDILSVLPEGEFIMEITNPFSPVIFRSPLWKNFLSVVCPLKIDEVLST